LLRGLTDAHREAIEPVLAGAGLAVLCERADGVLEGLGASEPAPALLDELIERRLAARSPGGSIRLPAACNDAVWGCPRAPSPAIPRRVPRGLLSPPPSA